MTAGTAIMFAVAAAFGLLAAYLFARLLRTRSERATYALRMTATMAAAAAFMLGAYATALWRWSVT
jgi:hypothetical protein